MYDELFTLEELIEASYSDVVITLSVVNLLDESDDDWARVDAMPCPPGLTLIVGHGTSYNTIVKRIYLSDGRVIRENITLDQIKEKIPPEELYNTEIYLLACGSGANGWNSMGQRLAEYLGTTVYAPLEDVQLCPESGVFYVSDDIIDYNEWTQELFDECKSKWIEFPL